MPIDHETPEGTPRNQRLFLSIALSNREVALALSELQRDMVAAMPNLRLIRDSQLHITLAFMREVPPRELGEVVAKCVQLARLLPPVTLQLGSVGCFPSLQRPKVFWAGVAKGREACVAFMKASAKFLTKYVETQQQPAPHVTIARATDAMSQDVAAEWLRSHKSWQGPELEVKSISLVQSRLTAVGAKHDLLQAFPLTG